MKKIIIMLMVLLLIGCQQTSAIKDKSLRNLVNEVQQVEGHSLEEITTLDASNLAIESLEGIELLINLEVLTLSNNDINCLEEISQLEHLKLLDIQNNDVRDISPLQSLKSLEALYIRNNPVDSIEVLKDNFHQYNQTDFLIQASFNDPVLEAVIREELNLPEGNLSYYDLEKLRILDLRLHEVTDLKGLELARKLEKLYVTGDVENIDVLEACENLKELELTHGKLEDLSFLTEIKTLVSLDLRFNSISNVTPLSGLNKLKYLNIKMNQVKNLSSLDLKSLKSIYVSGNPIIDYLSLPVADQIKETDIHIIYFHDGSLDQAVKDTLGKPSGIITKEDLKKIRTLEIPNLEIKSLGGIELLENLVSLNASSNMISDLHPLEKLNNLQILNLSDNKISDITPLSYLGELKILDLTYNQIETVEALTYLNHLEYLYLVGNTIEATSLKEEILTQLKGTDDW